MVELAAGDGWAGLAQPEVGLGERESAGERAHERIFHLPSPLLGDIERVGVLCDDERRSFPGISDDFLGHLGQLQLGSCIC